MFQESSQEMSENLFEIIRINKENPQEDHETIKKILRMPYATDFFTKTFKPKKYSCDQLITAMTTAAYLNLPSTKILDEFLWKLNKEGYTKYFTRKGYCLFLRKDIPIILSSEIKLHYGPGPYFLAKLNYKNVKMEEAAAVGNLRLLKYIHRKTQGTLRKRVFSSVIIENAAAASLKCLKFLDENGYEWDIYAFYAAIMGNKLDCLMYMQEHGLELAEAELGVLWNKVCVSNTSIEVFQYLHKNLKFCNDICTLAALYGRLDYLKYAHEHGAKIDAIENMTCEYAASNGNLDCLKYAHENGAMWNANTCEQAARNDKLDCLEYAHENGCEWSEETCSSAIQAKSLRCLKYALEKGCPIDFQDCMENAITEGSISCLKYLLKKYREAVIPPSLATLAVQQRRYRCLKFLHKKGAVLNSKIANEALSSLDARCFTYLIRNGCRVDGKYFLERFTQIKEAVVKGIKNCGCAKPENCTMCLRDWKHLRDIYRTRTCLKKYLKSKEPKPSF